jgi:3-phosphoshikimate 1-carboxyvinyltransferase
MPSLSAATVMPARRITGKVRVPGDKSISHRYALVAALADGPTRLLNYAPGADCRSTLTCLQGLGVEVQHDAGAVTILGRGFRGWRSPAGPLDAGNSGTTLRMLAGLLAGQPFTTVMVGDASLSRRPMRRIIEPLTRMGASITAEGGRPPLTIAGAGLRAIAHVPDVPSAQVKSAVLLAGLNAEGATSVTEPAQTRDHTERAFATFGIEVSIKGATVSVVGGQEAQGHLTLTVPGDFSSAAFWMVAAAALPGSRIELEDVGLNPTRTGLVEVLRRFGAHVDVRETSVSAGEPRGTVVVEHAGATAIEIAPAEVPGLIDELPAIAALAAHGGEVLVRGASELRVKESDRITALVTGLRSLGIDADEHADGFAIRGRGAPRGGLADARGDHRLAMAFAIAALGATSPSRIDGADVVGISYPGFFNTLDRLVA